MSWLLPNYWLAYLSENVESGPQEITAIAPEMLDRPRMPDDARKLLTVTDAYHREHGDERVVFAAAVTRWLHVTRQLAWNDLDIGFYDALAELDSCAPALLITASPVAMAIVGNAALRLDSLNPDGSWSDLTWHTEPVRDAIIGTLERDWAPYISRLRGQLPRQP